MQAFSAQNGPISILMGYYRPNCRPQHGHGTEVMSVINPKYEVLFDPVPIGPVTAPNRFYQVPHASGMTEANPRIRAAFRGAKAEGGWGVVSTGAVSTHPSSDDSPLPFGRLWDNNDIKAHALATDAIHEHGSLAAIELWHGGASVMNRTSRIPGYSPSGIPWAATHVGFMGHQRPRVMDAGDIQDVIKWQAAAARRARQAGYDIVYVYAGMGYLGYPFLLEEYNQRTDAYGGSVANRVRFVRELLETTREEVGDTCGVADPGDVGNRLLFWCEGIPKPHRKYCAGDFILAGITDDRRSRQAHRRHRAIGPVAAG